MRKFLLIAAVLVVGLPFVFVPTPRADAQISNPACIGNATLSWIEPTLGTDDLPLVDPITGFTIYVGLDPSSFTEQIAVANGIAAFVVDGLCDGTYYFTLTASNVIGEGPFSNVGSKTIDNSPFPLPPAPEPERTAPGVNVLVVQ